MTRFACRGLCLLLLFTAVVASADDADNRFARLDSDCFERMPTSLEQCEKYVAELEEKAESDDDAALLYAVGSSRLANFTDDADLAAQRAERGRAGLRDYLAKHPNDISALFEMASVVDSDERIEILKRIAGIDRSNTIALRLLVRDLSNSDDEEDRILALRYLEQGYQKTSGAEKLSFGSWMFEAMVANDRPANAVQIQQRIAKDFDFAAVDFGAPTERSIAEYCQHGFFVVQLEETCIKLIRAAAAEGRKTNRPYSTAMLEAIELLLSSREALQGKFTDYALSMRDVLEDHPGDVPRSGYYYLVYSLVVTGDRRIAALRSALQQGDYHEPRIRHWLGVALRDQGELDEARAELIKVRRGEDEELAQVAEFELSVLDSMQQ